MLELIEEFELIPFDQIVRNKSLDAILENASGFSMGIMGACVTVSGWG